MPLLIKLNSQFNMKGLRANCILFSSLAFLFTLWSFVSHFKLVDTLFLPSPYELVESCRRLFLEKGFIGDIGVSIYRVMLAFFISVLIAVPLAVMMSNYKFLNRLIAPYIDFIRYLPVPTLIPLTILFFGIGESAKIALLFTGTFFQLILLIIDDLNEIPKAYYDLAFTLKYNSLRMMKMKLQSILPNLYDNCRITLGWCWTYLVIAELVASQAGIGHMIKEAQRFSNTPDVYVGIITMGVIGFVSDWLFKKYYPVFFKYKETSK